MTGIETKESVKSLSFASKDFDPNKYAAVAMSARLASLQLTNQQYSVKPEALELSRLTMEEYKFSYSGGVEFVHLDAESGSIFGSYKWSVNITLHRKKVVNQKASFILVYEDLLGNDESYCNLYFVKLSRFTTYPYFRSIFSANAANSGLMLPPLPSLRDRMD